MTMNVAERPEVVGEFEDKLKELVETYAERFFNEIPLDPEDIQDEMEPKDAFKASVIPNFMLRVAWDTAKNAVEPYREPEPGRFVKRAKEATFDSELRSKELWRWVLVYRDKIMENIETKE